MPYPSLPLDNLIGFNNDGLGGVVQPRSINYVTFEIRPNEATTLGSNRIYFYPFDSHNFLHKYLSSKIDNYRLRTISSRSWTILSKNIIEKVKSAEVEREFLYETVNELSAHDIKIYRLDELITFHINRIDGAFFQGI